MVKSYLHAMVVSWQAQGDTPGIFHLQWWDDGACIAVTDIINALHHFPTDPTAFCTILCRIVWVRDWCDCLLFNCFFEATTARILPTFIVVEFIVDRQIGISYTNSPMIFFHQLFTTLWTQL